MSEPEVPDLRVPAPWQRFAAWLGPPRGYSLTRWAILRLLGVVYAFAFLGIIRQGPALLGSHGLTPAAAFLDYVRSRGATFWDVPTIFFANCSDGMLQGCAYAGLLLALIAVAGYANLPSLAILWVLYGSFERVGQSWFGFGWESQLLETGVLAALLAHPWDPRPLAPRPPPATAIVLFRWLALRIMIGAGLIKLRGDPCWHDLTCLDGHFETQPIPNPLSAWFHHQPHAVHAAGVVLNHVVELVAPWFAFGPRRLRIIAGCLMAAFQLALIASGNLAFLNWLTLIPILACFDDDALLVILPRRARTWVASRIPARPPRSSVDLASAFGIALAVILLWDLLTGWLSAPGQVAFGAALLVGACIALRARDLHQLALGAFTALVLVKSIPVVKNLASSHQAMNESFDQLSLVNTYGAFGSVGKERYELVIEGTLAADPDAATWREYELPCKPGDVMRRPCVLGPYHRRLDWLIWFSAMRESPARQDFWLVRMVWQLLDGDRTIRTQLAVDPFDGQAPRWIRIRRFRYRFAPPGSDAWWVRSDEAEWLPPMSLKTLRPILDRIGYPGPADR